ncbi:MAG: metallophosphoesterase family protein [Myxococcota bacterium]
MQVERRQVELPPSGPWVVAIVADTHSKPHPSILEHLRALQPNLILHGGDIGDLGVLTSLEAVAPLVAVRGNIDGQTAAVPEAIVLDCTLGARLVFRIFLTHIAVAGPRIRPEVRREAQAVDAQLVVCGHSHVPFLARDRGLAVFNPGSIGPRRFQLPITYGVLRLEAGEVKLQHYDCETNQRWLPSRS